jgi:predicted GNAT family N-acyltransferase
MNKAGRRYEIKVFSDLSSLMEKKVIKLRKSVPDSKGRIRTREEEAVHRDKYCSDGDIVRWILAFEQEDLIGMAAVFRRDIKFNEKQISLGGIGKMRVRQDRRRRGIASEIMNKAMDELIKLSCDVAFLCTNIDSFLRVFYEKYGFILLNKQYTYLSRSGKRYLERNGMLAPIKSENIFQEILRENKPFDIGIGNW